MAKGTIITTDANEGLGSAIAQHIISQPELAAYHGLYTVRNPAATTTTNLISALKCNRSHSHDVIEVDLTSLDAVREAARSINDRVALGSFHPSGL